MQISDPKQMVKFVKELQKVDGKRIDQGIKAMGQQLEQEQAAELGVDGQPTVDGPAGGGQQVMAPKPGADAGGGAGGPPQAGAGDTPPGAGAQGGAKPPAPKPKTPPPGAAPAPEDAAIETVKQAGRVLARSRFAR